VVSVDIWDMAVAVHYTDYRDFYAYNLKESPKVKSFGEWVEYWNVLGHWKTMPNYRELRKAMKDQEPWVEVCS
jgi:hypothetical protein